jgi:hypothetical protein
MHMVRDDAGTSSCTASYKTYTLLQVKEVINRHRKVETDAGLPQRKLSPVARYLLDELIQAYLKDYAPKGIILEEITIEDSKHYGL